MENTNISAGLFHIYILLFFNWKSSSAPRTHTPSPISPCKHVKVSDLQCKAKSHICCPRSRLLPCLTASAAAGQQDHRPLSVTERLTQAKTRASHNSPQTWCLPYFVKHLFLWKHCRWTISDVTELRDHRQKAFHATVMAARSIFLNLCHIFLFNAPSCSTPHPSSPPRGQERRGWRPSLRLHSNSSQMQSDDLVSSFFCWVRNGGMGGRGGCSEERLTGRKVEQQRRRTE